MLYQPKFLDNQNIFSESERNLFLDKLKSFDLNNLLSNHRNVEEYSIDFVYSSAQIEGNSYDKIDTLTLLKYGQTSGGKKFSDAVMLLNLRKSFDFVINNLDSSLNEGELKTFIKDSHAIISKDLVLPNESGIIRNGDVLISGTSYKPLPPGQKLEDEFRYLCNIASNIQCPLNKAVYLHNNLCYLQYFVDCNKRTARNIMAYTLMNNGVFPILFSPDSKKDYIQSIIHYYETGEYNLFKQYFLSQIELMNKFLPQDENCFLKRKMESFKI